MAQNKITGRYTVDEEALGWDEKGLVKKGEATPKPAEVLINDAIKDLSKDIAKGIVRFFR